MTDRTRKEALFEAKNVLDEVTAYEDAVCYVTGDDRVWLDMAIKALEQEPCEDCISRQAVLDYLDKMPSELTSDGRRMVRRRMLEEYISDTLPSVTPQPKIGHCRDCKWWKDSDGVYRRDCYTESKCPMNRREVYEGNGYCFMFEPQESKPKESD